MYAIQFKPRCLSRWITSDIRYDSVEKAFEFCSDFIRMDKLGAEYRVVSVVMVEKYKPVKC